MGVWFTSDQHFGHARLLELSRARGAAFATVCEMNALLVDNWNAVVQPDDTVWVLGDVDMHGKDATLGLIEQLVGTKILIAGNHDSCWAGVRDGWKNRDLYLAAGFAAVMDFGVTTLLPVRPQAPATRVLLSHFPYAGDSHDEDRYAHFRLRDEGVPLLHGHVHETFRERRRKGETWGINVGVDCWDYAPVSAERLAQHLEESPPRPRGADQRIGIEQLWPFPHKRALVRFPATRRGALKGSAARQITACSVSIHQKIPIDTAKRTMWAANLAPLGTEF